MKTHYRATQIKILEEIGLCSHHCKWLNKDGGCCDYYKEELDRTNDQSDSSHMLRCTQCLSDIDIIEEFKLRLINGIIDLDLDDVDRICTILQESIKGK